MPDRSVASGAVVELAGETRLKESAKSGQGQAVIPFLVLPGISLHMGQDRERPRLCPRNRAGSSPRPAARV